MYYQQYNPYQNYGMSGGITWVQGVEGAKAHPMQHNTSMVLMDSEIEGRMYIKTMDSIGISNLRYFDYNEIEVNKVNKANEVNNAEQFVSREEFDKVISEIRGVIGHA